MSTDVSRMENIGMALGKRIVLEEISPAHFSFTLKWLENESLRRELVIKNYPYSKKETAKWYKTYKEDESRLIYIARLISSSAPIGQIGFNRIDHANRNGEMHIFIGEQEYRGKGYGREMMEVFLDIAFNRFDLIKVWLKVNDDNVSAIRFYKKMGFVREGLLKHHEIYNGCLINKYIYSRFNTLLIQNATNNT